MILISQKRLDELFEQAITKMKADRWSAIDIPDRNFENSPLGSMHGAFHYEVCRLKQNIENEP